MLAKIPGRDALVQEWLALDKLKPAAYSEFAYREWTMFYKKTLGGENVGKLYYREGWDGAEKLLFDPGTYKAGGGNYDPEHRARRGMASWQPSASPRAARSEGSEIRVWKVGGWIAAAG